MTKETVTQAAGYVHCPEPRVNIMLKKNSDGYWMSLDLTIGEAVRLRRELAETIRDTKRISKAIRGARFDR